MAESGRDARLYAGLPLLREARTWAEINIDALCHNYRTVCAHLKREGGETPVICVVKADAYGHGAGSVARALIDEGCRFFAVSCIEEGEELRGVCRRMGVDVEILILGYTRPALAERLAKLDLITTLVSAEYAYALAVKESHAFWELSKALTLKLFQATLNYIFITQMKYRPKNR